MPSPKTNHWFIRDMVSRDEEEKAEQKKDDTDVSVGKGQATRARKEQGGAQGSR